MAKKYIVISDVVRMVKEFRSAYPESIFPNPTPQGDNSPAMIHAHAVRLTCDNLLSRLPVTADEVAHDFAGEEAEIEEGKKKK